MSSPRRGKIIVFGILFWYPLAGVTYQFLHYLLALRKLGYDPWYVEDCARWFYDPTLNDITPDASRNVAMVEPILAAHGFADRWALRGAFEGGRCYGMSESQLKTLYREADACLNVTGSQDLREDHLTIPRRIYVESDPFASQVRVAKGDAESIRQLSLHDTHFTFGENIGQPDCAIPPTPFKWQPTRQPVSMELWEHTIPAGPTYNTITTWTNKNKNIEWQGDTWYWTKDREFEHFLDLPQRRPGLKFELAAGVPPEVDVRLKAKGWSRSDSIEVSRSIQRYQEYIMGSRGEFTVARDQYVRPNTGWFSDRTCCYLAAGRPVITQETGFSKYLPTGQGLFGFRTMDDILAALDKIESDYPRACRSAKEVGREYFAAERVVGSLLKRSGL